MHARLVRNFRSYSQPAGRQSRQRSASGDNKRTEYINAERKTLQAPQSYFSNPSITCMGKRVQTCTCHLPMSTTPDTCDIVKRQAVICLRRQSVDRTSQTGAPTSARRPSGAISAKIEACSCGPTSETEGRKWHASLMTFETGPTPH